MYLNLPHGGTEIKYGEMFIYAMSAYIMDSRLATVTMCPDYNTYTMNARGERVKVIEDCQYEGHEYVIIGK